MDGITYRAQDRNGVELPDYAEDKSRYRVPIGDRGEISLYCNTIEECRTIVRQSGYHDRQVNPPAEPEDLSSTTPGVPVETTAGD